MVFPKLAAIYKHHISQNTKTTKLFVGRPFLATSARLLRWHFFSHTEKRLLSSVFHTLHLETLPLGIVDQPECVAVKQVRTLDLGLNGFEPHKKPSFLNACTDLGKTKGSPLRFSRRTYSFSSHFAALENDQNAFIN